MYAFILFPNNTTKTHNLFLPGKKHETAAYRFQYHRPRLGLARTDRQPCTAVARPTPRHPGRIPRSCPGSARSSERRIPGHPHESGRVEPERGAKTRKHRNRKRSEEHTTELQSLMRTQYALF